MAKKRPTQVGISLEGVTYRAYLSSSMLLKPWLHVVHPASVTIDLMSNLATPRIPKNGSRTNAIRKLGGSRGGSSCQDTGGNLQKLDGQVQIFYCYDY
jgi:hypothetical protein